MHSFHGIPVCATQSNAQLAINTTVSNPYSIVQRSADSRIWQRTTYETSSLTGANSIPHIHQYTELASGLCYQKDGQWADSQEEINILPDGTASATNGQNQVYFPNDIYNGVIEHITPDGLHLRSQPVGLCYFDGTNIVLIAELTNSVGVLVNSKPDLSIQMPFTGLSADLRYSYTKTGLEQDVILQERPPAPEAYGLESFNYPAANFNTVFFFAKAANHDSLIAQPGRDCLER